MNITDNLRRCQAGVLAAGLVISPFLDATELNAAQRAQILDNIPQCIATQRAEKSNLNVSDKVITAYCNCIYKTIVNRLRDEDITAANRGNTSRLTEIRDEAADQCAMSILNKPH